MRRLFLLGLIVLWLAPSAILAGVVGSAITAAPAGTWLDVPFVKQTRNGCGPAAIAMVIAYWQARGFAVSGGGADLGSIKAAVYSDAVKGTRGSEMQRYLERAGFRAFAFQGEWTDLEQNIAQGRPLIVALGEPRPFHRATAGHYAVVAGVDSRQGFVLLNDPARRKLLRTDRAEFERAWDAANRWTLLAVPGQAQ